MKNYPFYLLIGSVFLFGSQQCEAEDKVCNAPVECRYDRELTPQDTVVGRLGGGQSYQWSYHFGGGYYPDKLYSLSSFDPSREACSLEFPECTNPKDNSKQCIVYKELRCPKS